MIRIKIDKLVGRSNEVSEWHLQHRKLEDDEITLTLHRVKRTEI